MKNTMQTMVLMLVTVFSIGAIETVVPTDETRMAPTAVEQARTAPADNPLLPPGLMIPFGGSTLLYYSPSWEQAWE